MNFLKKAYPALLVAVGFALSTPGAFAAGETVEGIVTSAGSLIDSVKPIVIGAVAFGILISLVKMVRRK